MAPHSTKLVLEQKLRSSGLEHFAFIDILPTLQSHLFHEHVAYYESWLNSGYQGTMSYLERGFERRKDPRTLMPEALSVLSILVPYPKRPAGELDPKVGPRFARYISFGEDYHSVISNFLKEILSETHNGIAFKVLVDTSAFLERSWAAFAGLGWIGKNKMLIHPQIGSYFFIASVLLDFETGERPRPIHSLCGNCRRCLDGCPSGAFDSSGKLNSKRCISYSTLEFRGEKDQIDSKVRDKIGNWIAGCDICQEVCPFNFKPVKQAAEVQREADPHWPMSWPKDWLKDWPKNWNDWLNESESEYQSRTKPTAMNRVKYQQMRRNLFLAIEHGKKASEQSESS